MHYNVDYAGLTGSAKADKAIEDIKNYLGAQRFNKLDKEFKLFMRTDDKKLDFNYFRNMLNIGGISGYPVQAWAERLGIEIPVDS